MQDILDILSSLSDTLGITVRDRHEIADNPDLAALADKAQSALGDLYQAIGRTA